MKNKKVLGAVVFVVLIAIMAIVFVKFREKPVEGSKSITITVVNSAQEEVVYELQTDAKYLEGAMEEAKEQGLTYDGEEGDYGFTIYAVNGEKADFNTDGAYWSFYVNGEYCNYGISEQPVEDGDAFKIAYEKM